MYENCEFQCKYGASSVVHLVVNLWGHLQFHVDTSTSFVDRFSLVTSQLVSSQIALVQCGALAVIREAC